VPLPSFKSTFEESKNSIEVWPGEIALKVIVETKPEEVLTPGDGTPPWRVIVPLIFE
jgi:hypothetical protein